MFGCSQARSKPRPIGLSLRTGVRRSKITAISVFERGSVTQHPQSAGQIGKLWGLADVQIGDSVGEAPGPPRALLRTADSRNRGPPTPPRRQPALHVALTQLAEQDPLINFRQDEVRQEVFVSLYGEVQKEVIEATLANDYHLEVHFRGTTTICIERPVGTGAARDVLGSEENPFCATAGFRYLAGPGRQRRVLSTGGGGPGVDSPVHLQERQRIPAGHGAHRARDAPAGRARLACNRLQGRHDPLGIYFARQHAADFRRLVPLI